MKIVFIAILIGLNFSTINAQCIARPASITGNTAVCASSSQTYTAAPVSGASSYTWTVPNGFNITAGSTTNSITVTTSGWAQSNLSISVRANSATACSSTDQTFTGINVSTNPSGGGVYNGNSSICINGSTGNMNLNGQSGTVTRWEKRLNSASTWTSITNSSSTYSENPSVAGTWEYRAVVITGGCSEAYSSPFSVTVTPLSVGGTITGGVTSSICQGSSTGTLTLTSYTGSIDRWERKLNSGNWESTGNGGSVTFSEVPYAAGTWQYRAVVKSGNCSESYSTIKTVTVDATPVGGGIYTGNTPICINSSTGDMNLSGYTGTVVRWEKKLNSAATWTNITNTTTTYSESPSTAGTWLYRALVGNGNCTPVYSDPRTVVVSPAVTITPGANPQINQFSTSASLPYTANNGEQFYITFDAAAVAAGFSNQTQSGNISSGSGSITINVPYCITTGTYNAKLRVATYTPSCTSPEYDFAIVINPNVAVGGTLNSSQSVCYNSAPSSDLTLTGGTMDYVIKWQKSTDPLFTNPIDISTANIKTLTPSQIGPLTQNTYFRVISQANGCNKTSSSVILITVNSSPAPTFTVSPSSNICTDTDITYTTQPGKSNYNWVIPGVAGNDYVITNGNAGSNSNSVTLQWKTTGNKTVTVNYYNACVTTSPASNTTAVSAAPKIITQPASPTAICEGTGNRTITVAASGTNLTYLWKKDGAAFLDSSIYSGQGTATLTITNPTTANQGNYTVDISGDCTATPITSNPAVVTVNSASSAPTGILGTTTIQSGDSTTLSVNGGSLGTGAIVEWFTASCGGTPAGTGNSITVSPTSDTTYYVRYTGTCNTTTCATVTVTVTPPPCIPAGDQIAFGNESWIGHVYKWTGGIPNPDITALPANANVVYLGTVTENAQFDRPMGYGAVSGATTNITCETPPADHFFVRYKMITTTLAGNYVFTIGGDDGARLYIDGHLVVGNWADHGYTLDTARYDLDAGPHEFVLEYYENGGEARVSISYGMVQGDPTVYGQNTWNVYGYNSPNISLPATSYMGTYVDPNLSFDTQLFWPKAQSPSYSPIWQGAPMNIDNFAFSYKREGFPCGNYQLQLDNFDDEVEIYIDEVLVFHYDGYQTNPMPVGPHLLNKNSKVEVRVREAGGDANAALRLTLIDNPYNGTGTPTANTPITITSNLTLTSDLEVCSCTIKPGVTLTVPTDKTLTVNETITVDNGGKLVIASGGSLMQTNTSQTAYTGAMDSFELYRETTPVRRYDFTRWSSPVSRNPGFTLYDLSPETLGDKYFSYNPSTGWVPSYGGTQEMAPGIGYNVRAPQTFDLTEPATFTATFAGIPNNGTYEVTPIGGQYNLIGNPYPSALNAEKFITDNLAAGTTIGAIYLWTHNTLPKDTDGDGIYTYTTDDYAIFSLAGGTATKDRSISDGNNNEPSGKIASAQGFFIYSASNKKITFTNDMRVGQNNNMFFKNTGTAEIEKNRIWLNFKNAKGAFKQLLVGYIEGATNKWDYNYDAGSMESNAYIDFYSISDSYKMAIQGRALPFENTDQVPLGYVTTIAGDFTIAIDHVDGLFNDQAIYLEDKVTGKEIDLRAGNYTFTTTIGTFTNRFVLRYTSKTLGTGDFENTENGLLVSVKDKIVKVQSSKENIKQISVYDITGKLLYDNTKVNQTEFEIANLRATNQLLVVKITLENGYTNSKKIIIN